MTAPRDKFGRPIVVVTGMGVVTSLGAGKTDNWAKLSAGCSGIRTVTRFPIDGLKTTMAGTVDFLDVEPFSSTGLTERLAELATEEALEQSAIGSKGDFPGPLFLAVAPVEVEWPQRLELGRSVGKQELDYNDLLQVSGGGFLDLFFEVNPDAGREPREQPCGVVEIVHEAHPERFEVGDSLEQVGVDLLPASQEPRVDGLAQLEVLDPVLVAEEARSAA